MHRSTPSVVAALFLAALVGCSGSDSPTGSTGQSAGKRIKSNGTYAEVSATVAASNSADGRTVAALFGPDGGTFYVEDLNGQGPKDDLRVSFTIEPGLLAEEILISMTVSGEDLSTLDIAFTPAGLTFVPAADMRIDLGNDLAADRDISKIKPYHIYADGSSADVDVYHIDRSSNTAKFYVKVPSFSRYGLR